MEESGDITIDRKLSMYTQPLLIYNIFNKYIKHVYVVAMFIGLSLLASCQKKEESSANSVDKPVEYVFGSEITKDGKIYCTASSGYKKRLALIAFKFANEEITDSQNSGIFEPIRGLGKTSAFECNLSKLSMAGLADFSVAKKEATFKNSVSFFLTVAIDSGVKKLNVQLHKFVEKPIESFDTEIKSMETMCAVVADEVNDYGFSLLELSTSCKNSKKHFSLKSPYIFSGVIRDETPPSLIRCTEPAGEYYPDGACFLKSWFRNHSIQIVFSTKDVGIWRDIRYEVFETLEDRLVALVDRFDCVGKFCTKIGVEK